MRLQDLAHNYKEILCTSHLVKLSSQDRVGVLAYDRDNFVHGDLHAGNLLYDEQANVLTILDAGLVTTLGSDAEEGFGDFLRAMCAQVYSIYLTTSVTFVTQLDSCVWYRYVFFLTARVYTL